jgi:hypothetical protein
VEFILWGNQTLAQPTTFVSDNSIATPNNFITIAPSANSLLLLSTVNRVASCSTIDHNVADVDGGAMRMP